jgi:hypothetical protein
MRRRPPAAQRSANPSAARQRWRWLEKPPVGSITRDSSLKEIRNCELFIRHHDADTNIRRDQLDEVECCSPLLEF